MPAAGHDGLGELATLRVDGAVVLTYLDGSALDTTLAPRPFAHPVTTLTGRPVTDQQPEDHRWHLGVSVAIQDVGGTNFWGGRTYRRDTGYAWRDDHGSIRHRRWESHDEQAFVEHLAWIDPRDSTVLEERRAMRARRVGPHDGWALDFSFTLRNTTQTAIGLGSPATNGRAGAGYGGFFWRFPAGHNLRVFTATAHGESAVHGSLASWLAVATTEDPAPWTVVLVGRDEPTRADPWFVRLEDYPGAGSSLAPERPVVLESGQRLHRAFTALIIDHEVRHGDVVDWIRAADQAHEALSRGDSEWT